MPDRYAIALVVCFSLAVETKAIAVAVAAKPTAANTAATASVTVPRAGDALGFTSYAQVELSFLATYRDVVANDFGLELGIVKDDDSPLNLGGATISDSTFQISVGSEVHLSQTPRISPDAYAFILCHELGHLLGGEPKKYYDGVKSWSSAEGQADYFAASTCVPKLADAAGLKVSVAQRIEQSEEFFQQLFSMFDGIPRDQLGISRPTTAQKDHSVVDQIRYGHSGLQCRLDTAVAGVLGDARPACWYRDPQI